jgi:hypothetical protein
MIQISTWVHIGEIYVYNTFGAICFTLFLTFKMINFEDMSLTIEYSFLCDKEDGYKKILLSHTR